MRSFFRWLFFLLALSVFAGLAMLARRSLNQTPRAALEAGSRAAFGPDRDAGLAFRHLNFALRGAEAQRDLELSVEVLKARGRLYQSLGSLARARQDYEEVLRSYQPDELESQLALAGILLELGEDGEASTHIESVLERQPESGRALAIRAALELRYAVAAMTEASRDVDIALAPSERSKAMTLLVRASSLPRQATARLRLVDSLRALFPPGEERLLQSVLASLETATDRNQAARKALVASFASSPSSATLVQYLDLLTRSGRTPLALQFALAAAHHPGATADPSFLDRCAKLLSANDQPHLAVETIARHLGGNVPSPAFYERWCRLLYDQQRWEDLVIVAGAFGAAGNNAQQLMAYAYLGLANAQLGNWDEAQKLLRPYLRMDPQPPFPGAIQTIWLQLARCYRAQERPVEESAALRTALTSGSGRLPDEGELWLRLFELGSQTSSPTRNQVELERFLTMAMCQLPERLDELLPRWHELGQRNLDAARIDLSAVFDEMVQTQSYAPPASAGPYEMFELAQLFAARGAHPGVLQNCGALLTRYPGFRPAEDLELASRRALDDRVGVARLLLARLARKPVPPELVAEILALGPQLISVDQRLQLMRSDPRGHARSSMLDGLKAAGEIDAMVQALLALPEDEISNADRLLAGQLLLQLGHGDELDVVLCELPQDPELQAQAEGLRLRADLAAGAMEAFDARLADVLAAEQVDGETLRRLLEALLSRGEDARALALGRWLDEQPQWRTVAGVLLTSQAARRLGEVQQSEEGLVRADAALGDGSPELGYLLDSVAARDWGRLPERVVDLRTSGFVASELGGVLLDILGEDHKRAAASLVSAMARQPDEPLWLLLRAALADLMGLQLDASTLPGWSEATDHQTRLALRGPQGSQRDPREILSVLLASEHPRWRAWALAECEQRQDPDSGALWYGYAAARNWLREGDDQRAQTRAEALVAGWPEFAAGWDLLEQADRKRVQRLQGRPQANVPDELSWVRWRQREVLGAMPGDPALEHWMAALVAESEGDLELARSSVQRSIELSPGDVRLHLTRARLYAADQDWAPALTSMDRAIRLAGEPNRRTVVERALELHRQIQVEPPRASLRELLDKQREALEQAFPSDPLLAIGLARHEISNTAGSPDRGLAKAVRRLERLRSRTDGQALESLRRGSTRQWFEFLLEFDARLAARFAQDELRLRPESADLWRMLAEANEAAEQWSAAIERRQFLQASLPDPRDVRALVRLLARSGSDAEAFESAFTSCLVQENLEQPDLDLQIERARFLLESGSHNWPAARSLVERLWADHSVARFVPPADDEALAEGEPSGEDEVVADVEPLDDVPLPPDPLADVELPWEAAADAQDIANTRRIGGIYLRLLAWGGDAADAELVEQISAILEETSEDPLEREVLQAVRALAPRPPLEDEFADL